MEFGEKLKKLRTDNSLTQEDISKAIGVSRRTYIGYEQEGRYPRKREVYSKLAKILDCDVNYLITEDEEFVVQVGEQFCGHSKRQAENLVAELSSMFAGGELSESDMDAVMIALQKAYFDCRKNKKKYPGESQPDHI